MSIRDEDHIPAIHLIPDPTRTTYWLYDAPDLGGRSLSIKAVTINDPEITPRAMAAREVRAFRESLGLPEWHPMGCLEPAL